MKVEHKSKSVNEKLQLCCFNDLGALTQSACRDLYLKGTPLVYGRDHGSAKDREHLDLIIGEPQVTEWFGTAFETSSDAKTPNVCTVTASGRHRRRGERHSYCGPWTQQWTFR